MQDEKPSPGFESRCPLSIKCGPAYRRSTGRGRRGCGGRGTRFDTAPTPSGRLIGGSLRRRRGCWHGLGNCWTGPKIRWQGHPSVYHAGFLHDAQKEYAEGQITLALASESPLPDPDELRVGYPAYLNGMGEAVGEMRRAHPGHPSQGRHRPLRTEAGADRRYLHRSNDHRFS